MKNFLDRMLRWLGVAFILLFLLPIALACFMLLKTPAVAAQSVLHVSLQGALPELTRLHWTQLLNQTAQRYTLQQISQSIRAAASDPHIVGLILDIQDAALGLAQLGELHDALTTFRQSRKYNVAYLPTAGELSGGDKAYALASSVDQIILSPPGGINLNGLRAEVPFFKEALARLRVKTFTEQRYEFKNALNSLTQDDFTPDHLSALKVVLDDFQQVLLNMMAQGRHVAPAMARSWVEAAPWSAKDAVEQHLVDRLGYWDEVVAAADKIAGRHDSLVELEDYIPVVERATRGTQVAYIVGSGEISAGDSGTSPVDPSNKMGSETLCQAFRDARSAGAKAVLFRIDSPGGAYVASDFIRREVELTRQAGIPVIVSMGNVAASGGYLIATDADHIVVEPGSITGSIGVFAASFALREALQHFLGVHVGVYETLPHAGNINLLDLPDAASKARLSSVLDRIYHDFVAQVATTRHKTYEEIHQVAKGHIWSGQQAVERGLADELGGIDTALQAIKKRLKLNGNAPLALVTYPQPDSPLDWVRDYLIPSHLRSELQLANLPSLLQHNLRRWAQAAKSPSTVRLPELALPW